MSARTSRAPRVATVIVVMTNLTSLARSAPPDAVRIALPSCAAVPFDARKFTGFVALELRALGIYRYAVTDPSAAQASAPATESVSIDVVPCDTQSTHLEVRLTDATGAEVARHSMDLGDVPVESRARTLAIAVGELVRSGNGEASPTPSGPSPTSDSKREGDVAPNAARTPGMQPEVHRADRGRSGTIALAPPAVAPGGGPERDTGSRTTGAPASARSDHVTGRIEAAVAAYGFPNRGTALAGPASEFSLEYRHFRASAGAVAAFGESEIPAGTVDVRWATGYVAAGVRSGDSLAFLVEPRFYLGYGWATGSPASTGATDGGTEGDFVGALTLAAGLRGRIAASLDMLTDVELGYTLRGVTFLSDADRVAGLSRLVMGARVGVAFSP